MNPSDCVVVEFFSEVEKMVRDSVWCRLIDVYHVEFTIEHKFELFLVVDPSIKSNQKLKNNLKDFLNDIRSWFNMPIGIHIAVVDEFTQSSTAYDTSDSFGSIRERQSIA